ncbi:MAG: RidA family protein [Pseudomonadota bacterium]|nr:RidA family protein [Pseudomonadota bacterium]|tara:strand:- start:1709 stop:2095 length:387 start_codon:yes stop_codon:yes gene_type:complete
MKKIISTDSAPSAIGTYSQAVLINNFLYVSGQIALDPKNMKMVEGIDNQIEMVFKNIKEILKEAEMDFSNVIKLTILLDNLENFEKVNEIMSELFEKPYPARAAFEVSKLPKNSSIEVETIAYKGSAK